MAHYVWFVVALRNGAWHRQWGWFDTREKAEYLVELFMDDLTAECEPDQLPPGTDFIVIDRTIRFRRLPLAFTVEAWYDA